jgi:hypothetical protein
MQEIEDKKKIEEMRDMIDMRKLMNSKQDLAIPKRILVTSSNIRAVVMIPILIPMLEYLLIFAIGGMVMLLPTTGADVDKNWSVTAGIIFGLVYATLWALDMAIFLMRKIKWFYYTLLTLGKCLFWIGLFLP